MTAIEAEARAAAAKAVAFLVDDEEGRAYKRGIEQGYKIGAESERAAKAEAEGEGR